MKLDPNLFQLGSLFQKKNSDKLTWHHLKTILKQDAYLIHIINIADTCINLGHWPSHFKQSSTIIIPKPNKQAYDNPKSF